jgi:nucleotide-binding universal stress UspA family protein
VSPTRAERPTHGLRILVAVDGAGSADEALRLTAEIAHRSNSSVVVCHVAAPTTSTFDGVAGLKRARHAALQAGEHVLAAARAALGGIEAEYELLEGDPPEVICRRAAELDCDVVIVGSRGLGLLDRWLVRSVSSDVLSKAPCSVLVARRRHRRSGRAALHAPVSAPTVIPVDAASIRRGMDVYADGSHVGRVKRVSVEGFLLDRAWRRDVMVPLEAVVAVFEGAVLLQRSVAADDGRRGPP